MRTLLVCLPLALGCYSNFALNATGSDSGAGDVTLTICIEGLSDATGQVFWAKIDGVGGVCLDISESPFDACAVVRSGSSVDPCDLGAAIDVPAGSVTVELAVAQPGAMEAHRCGTTTTQLTAPSETLTITMAHLRACP